AVALEPRVRGYLLPPARKSLQPSARGRAVTPPRTATLARLSPPAQRPLAQAISRDLSDYVTNYTEPLIRTGGQGAILKETTEGKTRLDALRAEFARLSAAQQASIVARRAHSQRLRHRMLALAAIGCV